MLANSMLRGAAAFLVAVSCATTAGLGMTASALAADAAGTSALSEVRGAASSAADKGVSEGKIAVAEGLSEADAAAVDEGKTVRCIDQYFTNLKDAVELANQNGGGTIALLADTVATDDPAEVATIGFRTSIMIKSEGDEPLRIYRAEGQTGAMLAITDGTINLKNLTFDATGEQATAPVVMISDQAVVKFGKKFTITGNVSDGSGASENLVASAVSVSGSDAHLTLKEGCTISDCVGIGDVMVALYNDGATVENEGATFENNTAEQGDNPNYAGAGKLEGEKIK